MANKRKRNKFYAVVTDKDTNIYTSWEECQAAMKGKRNVKYKGFTEKEQAEAYIKRHKNKRVSVTPEKGKESNKTATPMISSPTKEQAEAQINQEQSPVSAEDTTETSDQHEEILKAIDDSNLQRKYCLENCKYENGDESYDTMLTCDICDGWYHLTCINLTQETALELSAWICHQCKANVGSVDFLKHSVLQSTGAIQELRHELAFLKNRVAQCSVAEGNKNADEFHGSEQSKLSFNVAHEPVPYDATTPQTRLPSQHLKTQDSTQHRLSYLEGKVESINEMFKFLMEEKRRNDLIFTGVIAKRQCQCDNDFEKKSLQEENNQLQKRVTELERIVISGDFKAKPNIIRQKDKRSQVSVDDEEVTEQFRQTPTQREKNANCYAETRNHQPNARLKAKKNMRKQHRRHHDHLTIAIIRLRRKYL